MKKLTVLCAGLAMLLATNGAWADLSTVGGPEEGGSWAQLFNETGVGLFNLVAVQIASDTPTPPDFFESPVNRNIATGWVAFDNSVKPSVSATIGVAKGPALTSMTWNIWFTGTSSNSLAFDFVAFNGQDRLESAHALWNGGWTITAGSWKPTRPELEAVPVPAAVLLGLLGLGAAGLKLRKFA